MDNQFKRLLNLVRRTGDRLVVTDPNGEDTYVLMGLEAYEKIFDQLSESEPKNWSSPNFMDSYSEGEDEDLYEEDYKNKGENFDFNQDWQSPDELPKNDTPIEKAPESSSWQTPKDIWSTMKPAGNQSETWDVKKFGPTEQKIIEEKFGVEEKPQISQTPLGVVDSVVKPTPDEPSEEQFYLEPIE